ITDSIVYASRIQKAMLPPMSVINNLFPNHFVFFKPRDVVSGDFYWVHSEDNYRVVVVADCTGHGVPGAFMSMLGISLLNELTGQYSNFDAAMLLGKLREKIRSNLHQTTYTDGSSTDTIDMGMIIIENSTNKACYAGGNIPLWIYSNKTLITYNADRMPVGIHIGEELSFTNKFIQLQEGDTIFMFSDGFPDQFGGKWNRKLLTSGFKTIIESIAEADIEKQATLLEKNLNEWKKETSQIDDIIVLGVKF
ncbi:MAG TPA: SpoIIE family protein phosphatase, partial [Salinivirgaceae bacterium]|nr:SpoIIE family protein phosphatase [Salinivirgaceae bacterium]